MRCRHQLDRWESLKNKGGMEAEALRACRIELEVHAKTLEGRLAEVEKREEDLTKTLEKEKRKVEKLKEVVEE